MNLDRDVKVSQPSALPKITSGVVSQLGAIFLARLVINTARRMTYTFAAAFARGLGVPLTSITSLIALNQTAGLFGPLFGYWGDRWGYRTVMLGGLGLLAVGLLSSGLFPGYATLMLALILAGLSKALFDPTALAYVGKRVPYHRRGLAMGLMELPWSASTLIGIPLVGLMIDRFTWRSPFVAMGCLAALSFVAVSWLIPRDGKGRDEAAEQPGVKETWRQAKRNPAVLAALGFALLMSLANDTLFVIYGVWLESTFSLSVVALGLSTMAIGVAELLGEGLTATVSDRLGLRQSLLIGMSFVVLTYLLLPLGEASLVLALGALFLAFLSFEFTVVTSFAYVSEIFPQARAVMMSSTLAAASIGRITGALIGGSLWLAGGMRANSLIAALAALLALTCVAVMTRRVGEKARPA